MPHPTLAYGRRYRLEPDPLVLASMILIELGCIGTVMIGLSPLIFDRSPGSARVAEICTSGVVALAIEFLATFGRSRIATLVVLALVALSGYFTIRSLHIESWRGAVFVALPFLIAIVGHIRWIVQISAWKAAAGSARR